LTDLSHLIVQLGTPQASVARAQIVAFGETAFMPLLDAIVVDDMRQAFITDAMAVFLSAGTQGLAFLKDKRAHGGWPRWNHAMQVLDRLSRIGEQDVPLLSSLAESPDANVSVTAKHYLEDLRQRQKHQGELHLIDQALRGGADVIDKVRAVLAEYEPSKAVEMVWPCLTDGNPLVRKNAAELLESLADDHYLGLEGWLDDQQTASAAATALGEIGKPYSVYPLLSALQKRPLIEAIAALGRLGSGKAVRPLLFFLVHRHGYGYQTAIHALSEIGAPAVGPLIEALGDENQDMRAAAAMALGETADARAVKPLMAMWRDPDSDVSAYAADALGHLESVAAQAVSEALQSARGRRRGFLVRAAEAAAHRAWLRTL